MRVFGDRKLVRKQDRVNFYDLMIRPFVKHTKILMGFEVTFFYPSRRSGWTRVYYLKLQLRLKPLRYNLTHLFQI